MIERCYDVSNAHFKHYGERGIKVCEEWRNSFKTFLKDMGEKPPHMSLDRIDNEKGYNKRNCRWASITTQNRNRRNCIKIHDVFHNWKIIDPYITPNKSLVQCVYCHQTLLYDRAWIKSGRKKCSCFSS